MTKQEALNKIKELEDFIKELDKTIGFKNDNIFLLSIEEYNRYRDSIPKIRCWRWLRSSGNREDFATYVISDGSVLEYGLNVYYEVGAVRPALKYENLKSKISESNEKNCFMFNDVKWKIIDFEKEIAISVMPITFDKFDDESNDYESSYIRQWLLNWAKGG